MYKLFIKNNTQSLKNPCYNSSPVLSDTKDYTIVGESTTTSANHLYGSINLDDSCLRFSSNYHRKVIKKRIEILIVLIVYNYF